MNRTGVEGVEKVVASLRVTQRQPPIQVQQGPENGIVAYRLPLNVGALISAALITALLILQTSPQMSLPPAG